MHEPTYREALRTAWQITTTHKFLIIFGLFAAFVGQLGVLDLIFKVGFAGTEYATFPLWALLPSVGAGSLSVSLAGITLEAWMLIAWLLAILIGFGILLTLVAVSSHGALIHATGQYINHPRKEVGIDAAWHAGVSHFWRLLGVVFAKWLVLFGLSLSIGWALINAITYGTAWDAVLFALLFVLALVVGMVVSFVAVYAAGYIVIEEYKTLRAMRAAWELFREHWLVSIEIGFTVVLLNLLSTAIAVASMALLFIPSILIWMTASGIAGSIILFQIGTFISVGLFILLIATLSSFLTVFTTALWMDLFQHMHRKGLTSRIAAKLKRS
jgi:hypothetical protein